MLEPLKLGEDGTIVGELGPEEGKPVPEVESLLEMDEEWFEEVPELYMREVVWAV